MKRLMPKNAKKVQIQKNATFDSDRKKSKRLQRHPSTTEIVVKVHHIYI